MQRQGPIRYFVLLLALAAMLGVATASSSSSHFHAKPAASGCDVCFAAHVASLEAKTIAPGPVAPQVHGSITLCAGISGYRIFRNKAFLTRGPPSSPVA